MLSEFTQKNPVDEVFYAVYAGQETVMATRAQPDVMTRCYGSLTAFNVLFKNKNDQFRPGARSSAVGSRTAERAAVKRINRNAKMR